MFGIKLHKDDAGKAANGDSVAADNIYGITPGWELGQAQWVAANKKLMEQGNLSHSATAAVKEDLAGRSWEEVEADIKSATRRAPKRGYWGI